MTQGYTRPFSPSGKATTVWPLPWKFAGDLSLIHFRTDPAAIKSYLPEPLELLDNSGEAFLWSPKLICHPVEGDPAALDPSQTGYNVCVIGLPAKFNGKPTLFSAFQWCDQDWLVVLSWFLGACGKGAEITQTSTHPLMARIGSPNSGELGGTIKRTVARAGQRIVTMSITPERNVDFTDLGFYTGKLPLTCMRHIPDLHIPPLGRPLVHDLTQMVMTDVGFGTCRAGKATLNFADADNEDLLPLQPRDVLGGYVLPMSFVLHGVSIVHTYGA
jgi:acetoacetate decarboxylase